MAKMYFICGFVGSGKTTYSKELAVAKSAFRFSIDEWMIPLYGEHMERDVFDARFVTLTNLFKDSALQMLNLEISVIFDFGFWKLTDRKAIAAWAMANKIEFEFIYLDVSYEVCHDRALERNQSRSDKSYEMTSEMLSLFWSWFEIPMDEKVTVVRCYAPTNPNNLGQQIID